MKPEPGPGGRSTIIADAGYRRECDGHGAGIATEPDVPGRSCLPDLVAGDGGFELFIDGDDLYDSMAEAIAGARWEVRLESYIFADDEVGRWFGHLLAKRARAGVRVRVHLDAAGSLFWFSSRLGASLSDQGVRLRWFHRWDPRHPLRYNRRNHRKLLVVDDEEAFVGGFNIHRENSRRFEGTERWRDTHVRIREPSLVSQAIRHFDAFWDGERPAPEPITPGASAALISNHSRACRHRLHCVYADAIAGARRTVYLTTPYFVPDPRTHEHLLSAARSGVDVRILVPQRDVRIAMWASRATYASLLRGGVRVFEYEGRPLHAKTAAIDDTWATVGTANLDYRSFFLNYELNLIARDGALCRALRDQFLTDLDSAAEVTRESWAARPAIQRVSETFGWLVRRWL